MRECIKFETIFYYARDVTNSLRDRRTGSYRTVRLRQLNVSDTRVLAIQLVIHRISHSTQLIDKQTNVLVIPPYIMCSIMKMELLLEILRDPFRANNKPIFKIFRPFCYVRFQFSFRLSTPCRV